MVNFCDRFDRFFIYRRWDVIDFIIAIDGIFFIHHKKYHYPYFLIFGLPGNSFSIFHLALGTGHLPSCWPAAAGISIFDIDCPAASIDWLLARSSSIYWLLLLVMPFVAFSKHASNFHPFPFTINICPREFQTNWDF